MSSPETLFERKTYKLFSWNTRYDEYYSRDWKNETKKYLSDKIKSDDSKPINWKWYHYENEEINEIPSLRGHSLSDIDNDSMITIGDTRKREKIDIYRISKYFDKFEKLQSNGSCPCCRFHHSSDYIASINCILFFGGFDSQCNFNDARLLSLDTMFWYNLDYNISINYRGHHCSASRLIKNDKKNDKNDRFEIYIFGGMYCNGGPYKYHNDIFKFTFYNGSESKLGYFECCELEINGNKKPKKRSQSNSWIKDDILYIFGGSYATSTLNDLWALNLNTNIWTEIEYKGILRAPQTYTIKPKNFRVPAHRKPCYFDKEMNELIVIHYGKLSEIQKEFIKYNGTLKQFNKAIIDININKDDDDNNKVIIRKKGAIGLLQDTMKCRIFVFDLTERVWYIKKDRNLSVSDKLNVPSKLIGTTRILRIGEYLIQIGGGYKGSNINYMKNLYMLKIPFSTWYQERLIWIGHYKNNKNHNDISIFNKCAKDVICLIISFL